MSRLLAAWLLVAAFPLGAQQWKNLLNGRNLAGWEVRGESIWTVMKDGTLAGQRTSPGPNPFKTWPATAAQYERWLYQQSWLYTVGEFEEFDLHLEYWVPPGGNSGVSIRDVSRARYSFGSESDGSRTPSHIGYEIQIIGSEKEKYPSGSVYLFAPAKTGVQKSDDWNSMDIEARHEGIRVRLNGELVAQSAGDPGRSQRGPIGLQLHDRFSWMLFRNIRIRESAPARAR
jgi:hypothetical protein